VKGGELFKKREKHIDEKKERKLRDKDIGM